MHRIRTSQWPLAECSMNEMKVILKLSIHKVKEFSDGLQLTCTRLDIQMKSATLCAANTISEQGPLLRNL